MDRLSSKSGWLVMFAALALLLAVGCGGGEDTYTGPCLTADADSDGVCDEDDVCPGLDDTADLNGNSIADCTETCEGDIDADGLCGEEDPCLRSQVNVCEIIEDFESGETWPWEPWVKVQTELDAGIVDAGAAHDGNFGWTDADRWLYRGDTTFGQTPDEVLSAWCHTGTDLNEKCTLGFGADASGTFAFQIESLFDKIKLLWTNYGDGYEDTIEHAVHAVEIDSNSWYRMEVHVRAGGVFDAQLFAADGLTPVASVQHELGPLGAYGVSLRGFVTASIDTIEVYRGQGGCMDADADGSCDADDLCIGDDTTGDADADGICDDEDVCTGLDLVGDADGDGLCDEAAPDPNVPAFYDPSGSQEEWAASLVCAEKYASRTEVACSQDEWQESLDDLNWILTEHPFTGAVFDSATGGGQSYAVLPSSLICTGYDGEIGIEHMFDDLNEMYYANSVLLSSGDFILVLFDWGVNVWNLVDTYNSRVAMFGGICELDELAMGTPTGFHATDDGNGWTEWTVRATEDCDFDGCRCDATVTVDTHPVDVNFTSLLVNDSGPLGSPSADCTDPRFLALP